MAALRRVVAADEVHPGCATCFEREARGIYSHRQRLNHEFGATARDGSAALVSLDLRFSNLCNQRCRMCCPSASSKIGQEQGGPESSLSYAFTDFDSCRQQVEPLLPALRHVYFAGGEPLIMPEHAAFLRWLLDRGRADIRLGYNTNLSRLDAGKEGTVLDLWRQFARVEVEVSVDGVGAVGELIRKDMSWPVVSANLRAVQQTCPAVRLCYGVTAQVLNVFHLPELVRCLTTEFGAGPHDWRVLPLTWPECYAVTVLPSVLKDEAARRLLACAEKHDVAVAADETGAFHPRPPVGEQLRVVRAFMLARDTSEQLPGLRERTNELDRCRHEATCQVVPELSAVLVVD